MMPRRRKDVAPNTSPARTVQAAGLEQVQPSQAVALHPSRMPRQVRVERPNPLQGGRRMDDMTEAELRAYARQVGICRRDADELSVRALKMNCQIRLVQIVDEL